MARMESWPVIWAKSKAPSRTALGIYPQSGTDRYWIGSPAVQEANIQLEAGNNLSIRALNQSPENIYVQSVRLNGSRICEPELRHSDLSNAEITFEMVPTPAVSGGYACESEDPKHFLAPQPNDLFM